MYGKNHYNIVISLQLIKINEKKKKGWDIHDEGSKEEEEKAQQDDQMQGLPNSGGEAGEVSRGQEGLTGSWGWR